METLADFHPMIVHFPIVLFILYFLFESSGIILDKEYLSKSALIILGIGVLAAVNGVLTGNQAAELIDVMNLHSQIPEELIEEHEEWATITLWFYSFVLALRVYISSKNKFTGKLRYIFIALSLIGCYLIYETAEHGGKLVYKYGAGTELIKNEINNSVEK